MSFSKNPKLIITLGLIITLIFIWGLKSILAPFLTGLAIAYLLDPVVDKLEARKLPRWLATSITLVLAFLISIGIFLLLIPIALAQIDLFTTSLPKWTELFKTEILAKIDEIKTFIGEEQAQQLKKTAQQSIGMFVNLSGWIANKIVNSSLAIFDIISMIIITPIVAFYLLRDWDVLVKIINEHIPVLHQKNTQNLLNSINETLAGFIRGQAMVCLGLGLFYAIGLSLAGLQFGIIVGLVSGFLSFIPFVGSIVGLVLSIGLAILQWGDLIPILIVAAIFVIGQVLEGNFLTPRFVGERVGLHPVWVMFALMAGGTLMGFVGILVAVPVAAVVGVLVRQISTAYKESHVFHGGTKNTPPESESAIPKEPKASE